MGGPSAVLIAMIALLLVAIVGVGAMFALKLGPFAPAATPLVTPTASPQLPTATPIARPSTEPTASPTSIATAAPTGSPGLTPPTPTGSSEETAALLSHIPDALRASCFATPGTEPIIALANCSTDGGAVTVTYFQYADAESMALAYDGNVLLAEIEPDSGSCIDIAVDGTITATVESWPAENSYKIGDAESGRWLCTDAVGVPTIFWTDDRLTILSQVSHTGADYDRLVNFWVNESGPDL